MITSVLIAMAISRQGMSLDDRIARVENGLLPAVLINGRRSEMRLSDRMAFYKVAGLSVAVIDEGRVAWAKGYGVRFAGGNEPVTAETLFQTASIGKMITATTAMHQVELGNLNLDQDVNLRLVSWKVPENQFTVSHKVTLSGLLSHTAGIIDGTDGGQLIKYGLPLPTLNQVLDGQPPSEPRPVRVVAEPGSGWSYSGAGFEIVEKLLEDTTHTPFESLVAKSVFEPAGMTHSLLDRSLPERLRPIAAYGHEANGKPIEGGWYQLNGKAIAAVWSTPTDMAKFAIELEKAAHGESTMIRKETMENMLTVRQNTYGLGMFVNGTGSDRIFNHTGHNTGFRGILTAYVDKGKGAVILSNSETSSKLIREVLRAIATEYHWQDDLPVTRTLGEADPRLFSRLTGVYKLTPTINLTVTARDGKLYIKAPPVGPAEYEMLPLSPTKFCVLEDEVIFTFDLGADGPAPTIEVDAKGHFTAKRIG